jgi:uncharacterized membrane protein HdeD (DUF308 family)
MAAVVFLSLDASSATIALIVAGFALLDCLIVVGEITIVAPDGVRSPLLATGLTDGVFAICIIAAPAIVADHLPMVWTAWALIMGIASVFVGYRTVLRAAQWPAVVAGFAMLGAAAIAGLVPLAGTAGLALLIAGAAVVNGLARAASAVHVARGGDDGIPT